MRRSRRSARPARRRRRPAEPDWSSAITQAGACAADRAAVDVVLRRRVRAGRAAARDHRRRRLLHGAPAGPRSRPRSRQARGRVGGRSSRCGRTSGSRTQLGYGEIAAIAAHWLTIERDDLRRSRARRRGSGPRAREVEAAARDRRGRAERPLHRRRHPPAHLRPADGAEALRHQDPGTVSPAHPQLPDDAGEPALRARRARGRGVRGRRRLEVSTRGLSVGAQRAEADQARREVGCRAARLHRRRHRAVDRGRRPAETIAILAASNNAAEEGAAGARPARRVGRAHHRSRG